ncbi:MAG: SpoIID/LytB domain-containing protein, partial [Myxococcota bacterium]|nr:SpoIID/LytB domain-containing protein [Myxococcota bacterium]
MDEPILQVGLVQGARMTDLLLDGVFGVAVGGEVVGEAPDSTVLSAFVAPPGTVRLDHVDEGSLAAGPRVVLVPTDPASCSFVVRGMTVGVEFHWQRQEDLRFRGALALDANGDTMDLVNLVPLEDYLVSVISSEMSASCPPALLRAHAIISRSWLLAQLVARGSGTQGGRGERIDDGEQLRIVRWYDREDHDGFDVCADDHCQRYQGVTRAFSEAASDAVLATRGQVLTHG